VEELISYHSVFEGFSLLESLRDYDSLNKNILENILKKYHLLKEQFIFSDDEKFLADSHKFLYRLAIGSRKSYSVYKDDISHYRGKAIYKNLFELDMIEKEYSREDISCEKKQHKKKEYRGYQVEDKIKICKNFHRFWFAFVYPYKNEIEDGIYENAYKNIEENLDYFISLNFEYLSNKLLKQKIPDIIEIGSYWDKHVELDLLGKGRDKVIYVGECKWKNHKISGNILNKLKKISLKAGFEVDYFVLFSKSGFSKELLKNRDKDLILYDLESFKGLFDG
jgi:hypothetical protein